MPPNAPAQPMPAPNATADSPATPLPDARGVEILDSIRSAFAAKGFDGASMQDLAKAAGMSVGNFYRYFPSKAAIVESMVMLHIARMELEFERIHAAHDPMTALRETIAQEVRNAGCDDDRLWAEITAAGQRKSELAAICSRMEEVGAARLAGIFALITGQDPVACAEAYGAQARYLVLMIRANSLRPIGVSDPALDELILQGIDRILDDIPRTGPQAHCSAGMGTGGPDPRLSHA